MSLSQVLFLLITVPIFIHTVYGAKKESGRSYDRVEWHDFESLRELQHTYMSQDKHKQFITTTHTYLGVYNPGCYDKFNVPSFRGSKRYAGGEIAIAATIPADEFPYNIEECAKLFYYRPNYSLEYVNAMLTELDDVSVSNMLHDERIAEFDIRNNFKFPVTVFYHPSIGNANNTGVIKPANSVVTLAWLGHIYSARMDMSQRLWEGHGLELVEGDIPGYSEPIDFFVVNRMHQYLSLQSRLQSCESYPDDMIFVPNFNRCGNMTQRFDQFQTYHLYTKRQGIIYTCTIL
jgi:hypothetical protein